jgi:hypothetical protein
MSLQQSLNRVQKDIDNGDLGKARDRLHGLIATYPDHLELRKQLGDIYEQLQMPGMAGRYWYLEEEKDEKIVRACQQFEEQFKNDPALILFALKFKGEREPIKETYAGRILLELHQKAREKHPWYEDFRNRGSQKYHHSPYNSEKHKTRNTIIKWALLGVVVLLVFFLCVGVISVIKWVF